MQAFLGDVRGLPATEGLSRVIVALTLPGRVETLGKRISDTSQQRVSKIVDAVGTERAASILGTRTRQVERWQRGTGQTTPSQARAIGKVEKMAKPLAGVAGVAKGPEVWVRRSLKQIGFTSKKATRKERSRIMDLVWILAPDQAPDMYETLYG